MNLQTLSPFQQCRQLQPLAHLGHSEAKRTPFCNLNTETLSILNKDLYPHPTPPHTKQNACLLLPNHNTHQSSSIKCNAQFVLLRSCDSCVVERLQCIHCTHRRNNVHCANTFWSKVYHICITIGVYNVFNVYMGYKAQIVHVAYDTSIHSTHCIYRSLYQTCPEQS